MKILLKRRWHVLLAACITIVLALLLVFLLTRPAKAPLPSLEHQTQSSPIPEPQPKPFTFPAGGSTLLPDHRIVALYGTPDLAVLGSLGEQSLDAALLRAKALATEYQPFSDKPVYPAFEIISTIAAAEATPNGDYSREVDIEKIRPWVQAAKDAGVYVLLDLQPGLTDFLMQAKQYESLLVEPHVGLALDPEWRLRPGQKHMKQIGTVSAAEVNQTAAWLADLVKQHDLPQKLLLLHQFKLSMITERQTLDTSRPELAWCIQMDGLGAQPVKQDTWRTIREAAPAGIHFGWKNFIDEDKPMLTPEQTMQVSPAPVYVSYQ